MFSDNIRKAMSSKLCLLCSLIRIALLYLTLFFKIFCRSRHARFTFMNQYGSSLAYAFGIQSRFRYIEYFYLEQFYCVVCVLL